MITQEIYQEEEGWARIRTERLKRLLFIEQESQRQQQQILKYQQMLFGKKSERHIVISSNQLSLFGNDEITKEEEIEEESPVEIITQSKKNKPAKKPSRQPLPEDLPRNVIELEPKDLPEGCIKIGEDITEVLEYIPSHVYVNRYVRPRYKKPKVEGEDKDQYFQADVPDLPIYKGKLGASILSHIIVSKFVDHLPFYRQSAIFERAHIPISESTINNSFMNVCELLSPLHEEQTRQLVQSNYLQADETPVKFKERGENKYKRGYHWVYHSPEKKVAVFDFQPSRSAEGPSQFLKTYEGFLQTDEYDVYNKLTFDDKITLLACMAHVRRKYNEAQKNDKKRSDFVLDPIQQLYLIERQAKEQQLKPTEIKQLRQKALPILDKWKKWMDKEVNNVPPKSAIGVAIRYTLGVWDKLLRYTEDGRFQIDNNLIENAIRPVAVGRKNYLFAGSVRGGQGAAMMYGFFATCKMHGVNPYEWLKYVLENIRSHPKNQISSLLPQNWKPPNTE